MHKNIPNKFFFINSFKKNNIDKLDNNTGVIYRNYNNKLNLKEIINIKKYCSKKKIKFYLSNDYKVAIKLGLDGAYIPSFNKDFRHLSYYTKSSFLTIGSAHNIKELRLKEIQKVKLIFISSLFKRNKNFLGIYKFIKLKELTRRKVIALGGISKTNKKKFRLLPVYGFGGISYFEKKKAPKMGPFN
tara:strand:+ start:992 stop:1552 length:561 start_codon:yes stop_codon:yes gene_type:complete